VSSKKEIRPEKTMPTPMLVLRLVYQGCRLYTGLWEFARGVKELLNRGKRAVERDVREFQEDGRQKWRDRDERRRY